MVNKSFDFLFNVFVMIIKWFGVGLLGCGVIKLLVIVGDLFF